MLYNKAMVKILVFSLLLFLPFLAGASPANDFTVNPQSTYAAPPGSDNLLILDLTLPDSHLSSIKIANAGTLQQYDIDQLSIYEDGVSAGWDGDEKEVVRKSSSPFWDTDIAGEFSKSRIFVTISIKSDIYFNKTVQPELGLNSMIFADSSFNGPADQEITGFMRNIVSGASQPSAPQAPIAGSGQALSTSTIRWSFTDLADNEFGFKILDGNLKVVAEKDQADVSYVDETNLAPNTEYSNRRVVAFNDRGESTISTLSVFPAVTTMALPVSPVIATTTQEQQKTATTVEAVPETPKVPTLFETIQAKIIELQQQVLILIQQLNELIAQSSASIFGALQGFFQSFFGR